MLKDTGLTTVTGAVWILMSVLKGLEYAVTGIVKMFKAVFPVLVDQVSRSHLPETLVWTYVLSQ